MDIFKEQSVLAQKAWLKAKQIELVVNPSIETISVMTASLIYIGGLFLLDGTVTIGVLIAFIGYTQRFWQPITNISNFYNTIITNMAYLERIFEVMDEEPLVKDAEGAAVMPKIAGGVEFKNVVFAYEEGNTILENVSFSVSAGESVALVGPTGAGKSTIVNLLSRFYNLSGGAVLIDGVDVSGVTLNSLRGQMGVMLQDTFIFSGTIMENIRYGRTDARDEEVIEAARAVCAHEFIARLEDGYYTEVNERGTRLSVGQRQLISFARALLADPKILILDEATSSIDTETEIALQKGLDRLLEGRTSFIIAHRLSTIKNASKIMYIANKGIAECGCHDELMKNKGLYHALYTAQFEAIEKAV
jgi:ATP-binding cassette subfamily B protein